MFDIVPISIAFDSEHRCSVGTYGSIGPGDSGSMVFGYDSEWKKYLGVNFNTSRWYDYLPTAVVGDVTQRAGSRRPSGRRRTRNCPTMYRSGIQGGRR